MGGDPSRKAYPGRCLADGTCFKKRLCGAQIGLPGDGTVNLTDPDGYGNGRCFKVPEDHIRNQRVRRQGDDAAALCDGVRIHARSRPQSSEAEHILNVGVNIVWLFTCVRIDMPLVKTQCRNSAAAAALPRLSKLNAARQGFGRGIEAAVSGESPSHHDTFGPAVIGASHGNNLRRRCVEIRREIPFRGDELEFAPDARAIRTDIAPAHHQSLRRGKIRVRNG
jgi:hypothetical protein